MFKRLALIAAQLVLSVAFAVSANAADKITLGTDWRAEPEHGGYYQALATGLYAKAGLDVTIRHCAQLLHPAELCRR
jgi:NitT/TauT family transport system substrate-binding protein